jgi:hypothetical protein
MVALLLRPLVPLSILAIGVVVALVATGLLPLTPPANALPPAGTETMNVTAEVSITSRAGEETVALSGRVDIQRGDPRTEDDVEVVDVEIVALNLEGESLTGPVVVSESDTLTSTGEIRSLQPPPDQFPASSFLDIFIEAQIPFAGRQAAARVHNEEAFRLDTTPDVATWPPEGATYSWETVHGVDDDGDTSIDEDTADDDGDGTMDEDPIDGRNNDTDAQVDEDPPLSECTLELCDNDGDTAIDEDPSCHPLFSSGGSHLKAGFCVTSLSILMGEWKVPTPTLTPCPPGVCTPTPTATGTPTATEGPTPTDTPLPLPESPTLSVAAGGPSGHHPAALLGLTSGGPVVPVPVSVSGNDNFESAWEIPSLPFIGEQRTAGMTTETGEALNPMVGQVNCIAVQPKMMGATVWYRFTPPTSGSVLAETTGTNFDTVLAAYTGDTLASITPVRCDDDSGPGLLAEVLFPVTAGVTYHFQIGGFNAALGDLRFTVSMSGGGGAGKAPSVAVTCSNLGLSSDGCDDGSDGDQDNVDALSFGSDFTEEDGAITFSVAPGSAGLPGTNVAQQAACSPAQPQADEFFSSLDGTNGHFFDGDGLNGDCPTVDANLGLVERPASDDLDALNEQPPSFLDDDRDGLLDEAAFFSLAADSPSLATQGRSAADVLWTVGAIQPGVYVSATDLGLQAGDDIDGLCVADLGDGAMYDPAVDIVAFSLASGSPTLAELGASAADVFGPGPQVLVRAANLGLQGSDDLNAMKCPSELVPPGPVGDADCDGVANAIDAALVLQLEAGIVDSLLCELNADANQDGNVNAVDAALILQFVAGIVDSLPPS